VDDVRPTARKDAADGMHGGFYGRDRRLGKTLKAALAGSIDIPALRNKTTVRTNDAGSAGRASRPA
jgi:hypothetical protein